MKSLKSAARRGGIISAAAMSALVLASCSAGQVTQTSSQVAAVDGREGATDNNEVAVRDVNILLDDSTGEASLKFTAINQDSTMTTHTLQSIEVDGQEVQMDDVEPMGRNCVIVGDSAANFELSAQSEDAGCIQYTETSLDNDDYSYGGVRDVTFTFDSGVIELSSTVSAPHLEAGEYDRDYGEGYTERNS